MQKKQGGKSSQLKKKIAQNLVKKDKKWRKEKLVTKVGNNRVEIDVKFNVKVTKMSKK